jgi:hypothetical protein
MLANECNLAGLIEMALFSSLSKSRLEQAPLPGLSLGVLVGNIALLWVWAQIPVWYRSGSADLDAYATFWNAWLGAAAISAMLLLTNAAVLYWATLPLALPHLEQAGPVDKAQFWKHHFVFWLCVMFHLVCLAFASWLALTILTKGWHWPF